MSRARSIIRKQIWDDEKLARILAERNDANAREIALRLRDHSFPARLDGTAENARAYATTWGLATRKMPPEEVRARILDKLSLLSEVPPQARRRVRAEAAEAVTDRFEPKSPFGGDPDKRGPAGEGEDSFPLVEKPTDDELRVTGIDQSVSPSEAGYWSSPKFSAQHFGDAGDAMRLIGADWATGYAFDAPPGHDGHDVNVVIVDEGLNEAYLRAVCPGVDFHGGFVSRSRRRPDPGRFTNPMRAAPYWHGSMIARNILRIAPRARIYDAPILPDRVTDVHAFTYDIEQLYQAILKERLTGPHADQPWIIVNAWAVADSIQEYDLGLPLEFLYSVGANHPTHYLMQKMSERFDIVFAAGNYGAFAPSIGAGLYNRGPNRSISGSNALAGVLTVGACDVTGNWIGTSSQGDGPEALKFGDAAARKPDLCAPAWFSERQDSAQLSSGTSAACAVAAGLAAALRSHKTYRALPTQDFFKLLREAAQGPEDWSDRTGHGVLRCLPV